MSTSTLNDDLAKDRADWLLDAVACATQDRRFLRGEPEYDDVAGDAILMNGEKAIRVALEAQSKEIEALRAALDGDVRLALHPGGSAVCLGGRWKGWLFLKHPDGQWVSSQPLEMIDPHDGSPFAALKGA